MHTQHVVAKTQELIEGLKIDTAEAEQLLLAAWFHDVGFVETIENHEDISAEVATNYLKGQNVSEETIKSVADLILSTKMLHSPKNHLEKIIRDADCAHLSSKNFSNSTVLLRKELELTQNKDFSDADWLKENIEFLSNKHRFYTDYASLNWGKTKGKNLAQLLKTQKTLKKDSTKLTQKKQS